MRKVFKRGNREGREEEIRIARIEYKQLCNKKETSGKREKRKYGEKLEQIEGSMGLHKQVQEEEKES